MLARRELLVRFAVLFIGYGFTTFCRRVVFIFLQALHDDLGVDKGRLGILVSTQAFCYTVSKVLFAFLCDRVNHPKLIATGMVGIGVATVFASMSRNYDELFYSVVLNGCVQGAGWTPSTLLVKKWSPKEEFGSWYSLFGIANTVSGMLLPYAVALFWRQALWYAGAGTLVWLLIFYVFLKEDFVEPLEHHAAPSKEKARETLNVFTSTAVFHVAILYAFPLSMRTVCETWFPVELTEKGMSPSGFQFFLEAGGFTGVLLSGLIVDLSSRKIGVEKAVRLCAYASTVLMMAVITLSSLWVTAAPSLFGFFCGAAFQGCINCWGLAISRLAPVSVQGSASALISLIANGGSVLAGAPLNWLQGAEGISTLAPLFFALTVFPVLVYTQRIPIVMEPVDEARKTE